ncbi:RsiV family protein [Chryseobacterium daecheongense]|uniref:RsiV family protein n=1 Tax=Chryseobacterium daecheongense TaxID=192389 RepID=UPI001FD659EE|nr:RsiV family protein [Chryseobacterium daecheongense]UOU97983.1 RsiV family protein [Chryseobacterium daecheongense]
MKNTIAVLAVSSFFVFTACKKNEVKNDQVKTEVKTPQTFTTDSVTINDSIKISDSLTLKYTSKLLLFPTIQDKKLLDSIYFNNKGIKDYSKEGLKAYLEKEKNNYYNSIKNDSKDWMSGMTYSQQWYTSSAMNLKSNSNDYLHIEYVGSGYEGGAHDNYGFSERVFDLKDNKKVELKDITSMPKEKLEALLMKNINTIHSGTTGSEGEIKNSEMLLVEVIPATNNFYFDDKNLYFHYSPYEIAAFAAGDIVIPISWQELKGTLNPKFKDRMKIK